MRRGIRSCKWDASRLWEYAALLRKRLRARLEDLMWHWGRDVMHDPGGPKEHQRGLRCPWRRKALVLLQQPSNQRSLRAGRQNVRLTWSALCTEYAESCRFSEIEYVRCRRGFLRWARLPEALPPRYLQTLTKFIYVIVCAHVSARIMRAYARA